MEYCPYTSKWELQIRALWIDPALNASILVCHMWCVYRKRFMMCYTQNEAAKHAKSMISSWNLQTQAEPIIKSYGDVLLHREWYTALLFTA